MPGVPWSQIREVALVAREALADLGLVGWPKTSGSRGIHVNVRIEPRWTFPEVRRAALALARDVERRAPSIATSKWWKEERHGVFLDYNQNAKDRTVASAYSVRPTPDARVSMPLTWDELPTVEAEAFTLATVPGDLRRAGRRRGRDRRGGRVARGAPGALGPGRGRGQGDAPWPPQYRKQPGEPPRVQPSKQRRAAADYDTPEAEAEREKARAALERRWGAEVERRAAGGSTSPEPADADRAPEERDPGHRDRPGREEGRRPGRPRALEGPLAGGRRRPGARRRPRRLDARPVHDLDPASGST